MNLGIALVSQTARFDGFRLIFSREKCQFSALSLSYRSNRTAEVRGSIPLSSTSLFNDLDDERCVRAENVRKSFLAERAIRSSCEKSHGAGPSAQGRTGNGRLAARSLKGLSNFLSPQALPIYSHAGARAQIPAVAMLPSCDG